MKTLSCLSDAELLHTTRTHVQRTHEMNAEFLLLLIEIDSRQLWAAQAYSSMFDFCTKELGFSEDVASNRTTVARLAQRFPLIIDFVRDGRIHLTGLRVLNPVLTEKNVEEVLAAASGKSKSEIEELVASLAPKPPVPPSIRKLPERAAPVAEEPPSLPLALSNEPSVQAQPAPQPLPPQPQLQRRPEVKPLSAEGYMVRFTADRALKAKLEQAERLMRHRAGRCDLVAVIDAALDLLIAEVKKERFGVGRKPRSTVEEAEERDVHTRRIPAAIQREVHERDGGQCTYVSPDGRRCAERDALEFEHIEGFARTGRHTVKGLTLHCPAHNQYKADLLYGRDFMEAKRGRIRPGADPQTTLL
jgi:hypothetical protein